MTLVLLWLSVAFSVVMIAFDVAMFSRTGNPFWLVPLVWFFVGLCGLSGSIRREQQRRRKAV